MLTLEEIERRVADACKARDKGMALAELADRSGWDINLIDQAIGWFAQGEHAFSANDLRELLPPDVRQPLIGARFSAWAMGDLIRPVGTETSTKRNTHCKRITRWVGNAGEPTPKSSAPPWVREAASAYRDARDAWEAQRESSSPAPASIAGTAGADVAMYQLEDSDYAAAFPRPRFSDFIIEYGARRRRDERAAS